VLPRLDRVFTAEHEIDLIHPVEQGAAPVLRKFELDRVQPRDRQFATCQIDGHFGRVGPLQRAGDAFDAGHVQFQRQQPILERIVVEDVAEAGGNDAADASLHQRPDGGLPRAAAAEVGAGEDDAGLGVARLIQDEILARLAVRGETKIGEHLVAQSKLRRLVRGVAGHQRRGDQVGVDVGHQHGGGDAGNYSEFLHCRESLSALPHGWGLACAAANMPAVSALRSTAWSRRPGPPRSWRTRDRCGSSCFPRSRSSG
jgi:hypothetical protein